MPAKAVLAPNVYWAFHRDSALAKRAERLDELVANLPVRHARVKALDAAAKKTGIDLGGAKPTKTKKKTRARA